MAKFNHSAPSTMTSLQSLTTIWGRLRSTFLLMRILIYLDLEVVPGSRNSGLGSSRSVMRPILGFDYWLLHQTCWLHKASCSRQRSSKSQHGRGFLILRRLIDRIKGSPSKGSSWMNRSLEDLVSRLLSSGRLWEIELWSRRNWKSKNRRIASRPFQSWPSE